MPLYCGNSECGTYLGSLGNTSCQICDWQEPNEEDNNAPSYLYCQGECGSYLGSLGGSECSICNWKAYSDNEH